MKFNVGDKVMAKWPGSSLYFHAQVTKIDEEIDEAEVLYEDGTEMEVPIGYLEFERTFRRKSKSPARARRRSRSRSPARTTTRQTRSRPTPTSQRKLRSNDKSHTSTSSSEEVKAPATVPQTERGSVRQVHQYQEKDIKENKHAGFQRITTRSYQAKVVLEKASDNNMLAKAKEIDVKTSSVKQSVKHKYEFGGPFGVLLQYLTLPLLPIVLLSCCGTNHCELRKFSLATIPQKLSYYYDQKAAVVILGYITFLAVIYALPIGSIVDGPRTPSGKKTTYRVSAFYTLFFSILAYCALFYFKYPTQIVYDKMFPMVTMTTALSFVLNILIHLKSYSADESELNPQANTGCTIYDIFMGRELHPKFGTYFQLKLFLYRVSMMSWILILLVYLQKEVEINGTVRPSLALLAGTQIFYSVFVFFMDEEKTFCSFDIKHEGVSFQQLFGNLVMVPFIYTGNARYLLEHQNDALAPVPILVTYGVLVVAGLCLIILSDLQKFKFRQNPYDPQLQALESIPPSKRGGDRLLVSGFWGFVRHPNYLGEILLGVAYGLLCGFHDLFPWLYFVFVTGLLFHRSLRDDARCQEKHGYAWVEYCKRVRYRVVPYIF